MGGKQWVQVVLACGLLGLGSATSMVCATQLLADLVHTYTESSAFVYGAISFIGPSSLFPLPSSLFPLSFIGPCSLLPLPFLFQFDPNRLVFCPFLPCDPNNPYYPIASFLTADKFANGIVILLIQRSNDGQCSV